MQLKPILLTEPELAEFEEANMYKKRSVELLDPLLDKFRIFSGPETVVNQSFCYEGLSEVTLREATNRYGLYYVFNSDPESMNLEKYCLQFHKIEHLLFF